MATYSTTEHNDGKHINKIVNSVPCPKHGRDINEACWNLLSIHGLLKAICNDRALAAGANGFVTPYEPTKKGNKR